jgi:hypothetical protein
MEGFLRAPLSLRPYQYRYRAYEGCRLHSTKNRFGNRRFIVADPDLKIIGCLNPDESRPNLIRTGTWFNVGRAGSRCPS